MNNKILKIFISIITIIFILISQNNIKISYAQKNDNYKNLNQEAIDFLQSEELKQAELESMKRVDELGKALLQERGHNFWSYQDGLICVTDAKTSGFNHGHAGIVGTAAYPGCTIEANPNSGVQALSADWPTRFAGKKVVQGGVNGTGIYQDQAAALWAESQMGKPYNYNFLNTSTRSSFYCSQLVWAAYYDTLGVDISNGWHTYITPFELVENPRKVIINYYREK